MVLAATLDSRTTSSTVMVVSPLVALMVDQVQSLRAVGVKASIVSTSKGIPKSFLASESSLSMASLQQRMAHSWLILSVNISSRAL